MSKRILVIDEDSVARLALRFLLEERGYTVTAVANCDEMLSEEASVDFDLVVLDTAEIDEVCLELLAQVRGLGIGAPMLITADYGTSLNPVTADQFAPVEVLCKPFGPEDLAEHVGRLAG